MEDEQFNVCSDLTCNVILYEYIAYPKAGQDLFASAQWTQTELLFATFMCFSILKGGILSSGRYIVFSWWFWFDFDMWYETNRTNSLVLDIPFSLDNNPCLTSICLERSASVYIYNGFDFCCQIRILLEKANAVSKLWDNAPVVLCGDFNCTPEVACLFIHWIIVLS